ncbi:MAG: hypothetical protein ACFB20_07110 [Opitutales bacterium]
MDLIDTLEALLHEETSALERADLTTLNAQILPRKEPLLKAFRARRDEWAQRRAEDPAFDQRMAALRERQANNVAKLQALRQANRRELAGLSQSAQRATGIRRAYGTASPLRAVTPARFSA